LTSSSSFKIGKKSLKEKKEENKNALGRCQVKDDARLRLLRRVIRIWSKASKKTRRIHLKKK
jgi:hypothetical protein